MSAIFSKLNSFLVLLQQKWYHRCSLEVSSVVQNLQKKRALLLFKILQIEVLILLWKVTNVSFNIWQRVWRSLQLTKLGTFHPNCECSRQTSYPLLQLYFYIYIYVNKLIMVTVAVDLLLSLKAFIGLVLIPRNSEYGKVRIPWKLDIQIFRNVNSIVNYFTHTVTDSHLLWKTNNT